MTACVTPALRRHRPAMCLVRDVIGRMAENAAKPATQAHPEAPRLSPQVAARDKHPIKRGVRVMGFTAHGGEAILVAVTSRGVRVGKVTCDACDDTTVAGARRAFEALLAAVNPAPARPALELVH